MHIENHRNTLLKMNLFKGYAVHLSCTKSSLTVTNGFNQNEPNMNLHMLILAQHIHMQEHVI